MQKLIQPPPLIKPTQRPEPTRRQPGSCLGRVRRIQPLRLELLTANAFTKCRETRATISASRGGGSHPNLIDDA